MAQLLVRNLSPDTVVQTNHPVHDFLYFALAEDLQCRLITADDRFRRAVASRPEWADRLVMLNEAPAA